MPNEADKESTEYRRALLLREFVYHVRRGNLVPYTLAQPLPEGHENSAIDWRATRLREGEGFWKQILDLCERCDKEFLYPVHAMQPMPEPTENDLEAANAICRLIKDYGVNFDKLPFMIAQTIQRTRSKDFFSARRKKKLTT